jgi:hypothetical protein
MSQVQQGATPSSSGVVPVIPTGSSTIGSGSRTVTTAGTRVQLSLISVPCRKVTIQALQSNTGKIYIGDSSVSSSNGIFLFSTQSFQLTPNNLNLVYLDSEVNGGGVVYQYEN